MFIFLDLLGMPQGLTWMTAQINRINWTKKPTTNGATKILRDLLRHRIGEDSLFHSLIDKFCKVFQWIPGNRFKLKTLQVVDFEHRKKNNKTWRKKRGRKNNKRSREMTRFEDCDEKEAARKDAPDNTCLDYSPPAAEVFLEEKGAPEPRLDHPPQPGAEVKEERGGPDECLVHPPPFAPEVKEDKRGVEDPAPALRKKNTEEVADFDI